MTMNNLQLDDAMICRLVDAHSDGVDFSHAIDLAHIPEMLAPSAKEYWDTLDGTALFRTSITPRSTIIDDIFMRAGSPVAERNVLSRPSPYMKYVMAFAAPVAILVFMVGVWIRPDRQIEIPGADDQTLAMQSAPVSTFSANAPMAKTMATENTTAAPAALRAAAPVAKSVVPPAVKPVPKDDPRQLFAMLTSAGEREARSEATIDATYDAQLAALNAQVVNTNNTQTNVTQ